MIMEELLVWGVFWVFLIIVIYLKGGFEGKEYEPTEFEKKMEEVNQSLDRQKWMSENMDEVMKASEEDRDVDIPPELRPSSYYKEEND